MNKMILQHTSIFRLIVVGLLGSAFTVQGQTLDLSLSQYAGKQVVISSMHGVKKDTLGVVTLDEKGKGSLYFGAKQTRTGIAALTVPGKEHLYYEFVLAPTENPDLQCDGEYVHSGNATLLHSPENRSLDRWFTSRQNLMQKKMTLTELTRLYTKGLFREELVKEQGVIDKALAQLNDTLASSPLFAAQYMQFRVAQETVLSKIWESKDERTRARDYFLNSIDFETLYYTGQWFPLINACLEIWKKDEAYYRQFGNDMAQILKKTRKSQIYVALAESAITITERLGWEHDKEALVTFLKEDNPLANPGGILGRALNTYIVPIGSRAPVLVLPAPEKGDSRHANRPASLDPATLSTGYSLLVFHQSDCDYCEKALTLLAKRYKELVAKGVRVLSFSADTKPGLFSLSAESFPWSDKYCDLQGLAGVNFKNYGVIGTPSMFLLDAQGKVLERAATVNDLLGYIGIPLEPITLETPKKK